MDGTRVDALARRLAGAPRRSVLRALTGGALALLAGSPGDGQAAKGCLNEGKPCKRGKQCCSGLCTGKAGRKACRRAPSQSICTVRNDLCVAGEAQDCGLGPLQCRCFTTTKGRAFCLAIDGTGGVGCASDLECALALGAGAACVRGGRECSFTTFCALPCSDPA